MVYPEGKRFQLRWDHDHWLGLSHFVYERGQSLSLKSILAEAHLQDYNSPQSPYWALKAFLPLILPSSHPFWEAIEEPFPSELLKEPYHVNKPWMQAFTHAAGHTYVLSAGQ